MSSFFERVLLFGEVLSIGSCALVFLSPWTCLLCGLLPGSSSFLHLALELMLWSHIHKDTCRRDLGTGQSIAFAILPSSNQVLQCSHAGCVSGTWLVAGTHFLGQVMARRGCLLGMGDSKAWSSQTQVSQVLLGESSYLRAADTQLGFLILPPLTLAQERSWPVY